MASEEKDGERKVVLNDGNLKSKNYLYSTSFLEYFLFEKIVFLKKEKEMKRRRSVGISKLL